MRRARARIGLASPPSCPTPARRSSSTCWTAMLDPGVADFVLGALPAAPARVLEVGAGEGDLARAMASAGYDVVAIDPAASTEDVSPIPLLEVGEPAASFDAAVAIV